MPRTSKKQQYQRKRANNEAQSQRQELLHDTEALIEHQRKRANAVELQLRHADVASLLLSRFSRAQIIEFSRKKWGVDFPSADKYIVAAKKLIRDRIVQYQNATVDDHVEALFDLIRRARVVGDLRLERDVHNDIAKLLGYYPAEKLRHGFANVSDAELLERANELARRIVKSAGGTRTAGASDNSDAAPSESDSTIAS